MITIISLDDDIIYCKGLVDFYKYEASKYEKIDSYKHQVAVKYAEEYKQRVDWLRELKQRRDSENVCQYCEYKFRSDNDEPCVICSHNYTNKFKDDGTRGIFTNADNN